jgi:hypothetical protein
VSGLYRLKVGDLEVTALFDGFGVFDPHWLNRTKATTEGVVKALHEDPHMLDVADTGFLVNTGKQLILVDAHAGTWWGGGAMGRSSNLLCPLPNNRKAFVCSPKCPNLDRPGPSDWVHFLSFPKSRGVFCALTVVHENPIRPEAL